jgi:translation initiation factor 5B
MANITNSGNTQIRQPIVTICGHVDHGKTSILDYFRGSSLQEAEAGGITQKISFTLYPASQILKACSLITKSGLKLEIPGFLFIDTPGHAAFTNLRKRGGSLADLAILVIDINEGIKPQTAEVIQILKNNKTPFLIALNKIDNISGWRTNKNSEISLKKNIETQSINVKPVFDERYMTIASSLSSYGFDADLFYNITDFTKKIALVPCSARTGEGIQELMMMLCGLSQKYLAEKLKLGSEAKGVILEIKKEKTADYAEAILYDGQIAKSNELAISDINGNPIIAKIKLIEEIEPLSIKFKAKEKVQAAAGLRLQFNEKIDVLPGMPFLAYDGNKEKIKEVFKKELTENIQTGKKGIIAKADSLGSLEALLVLLKQAGIPVLKAGIGNISKADFANAKVNFEIDELDALILGFNVVVSEDAKEPILQTARVKIITDKVVYKLIENLVTFREEKRKEIEKAKLMELAALCKLKILHQYVFRNTKPAIFGVKVEAGKLNQRVVLITENQEKIGHVKNIQSENKGVEEAGESMEVAISVSGVNFERELKDRQYLYSELSEKQFKSFKKNKELLSQSEIKLLSEIAELKRKKLPEWGK